MAENILSTPQGQFELVRAHTPPDSPLRAWSAADQLVLDELGTEALGRVLIVNDDNGALSVALAGFEPVIWGDSALSRDAIAANLDRNGLASPSGQQLVKGDQRPTGCFDTIVVRVPKSVALLEYQLAILADCCGPETRVIGAAMARHIHRSTVAAFEQHLGPTSTSLATRKARLIHVDVSAIDSISPTPPSGHQPAAVEATAELQAAQTAFVTTRGVAVVEAPGTFSSGHVDIGSTLLLDVLSDSGVVALPEPEQVADLGCGNGVLAATMATSWPTARFTLFDVSDLAAWAAHQTWQRNDLELERVAVHSVDGFGGAEPGSFDVVVTNPPFHQGHALDNHLTDRLLRDTARTLTAGGSAFVVAQRHLHLHTKMQRWFGTVDVISKHPSHVVLHATRSSA